MHEIRASACDLYIFKSKFYEDLFLSVPIIYDANLRVTPAASFLQTFNLSA